MKLKQSQICRVLEALGIKQEDMDKQGGFTVDRMIKDGIASGRIIKLKRGEYHFVKVKP